MAENQYGRIQSPSQELVSVPFSFLPAGTGAPTGVKGKGFTVTRTGVGLYRFTFDQRWPNLLSFSAGFALLTLAQRQAVLKTVTTGMAATNTIDVQIIDAAAAAVEIAADPANIVFGEFVFSNTMNPSL